MEAKKIPENKEDNNIKTKTKNNAPKKAPKKDKDKKVNAKKVPGKKDNAAAAASQDNIFNRGKRFLRGAWLELKKVNWLGRKQIATFTVVVLVSVILVAAAIFVVDTVLSKVLSLIIT